MAFTLQSRYFHILPGLLTDEGGRGQELRRRKVKPEAAWFPGTEKPLCPPEKRGQREILQNWARGRPLLRGGYVLLREKSEHMSYFFLAKNS